MLVIQINARTRSPVLNLRIIMPGIKPTNEELEKRALAVLDRMVSGHSKHAIRIMAASTWSVDSRTSDRYMARAAKILNDAANLPRAELINRAMGFYESVMRSRDATYRDKLRAQERIDKLFGLEAPTRTELTGANGLPIEVKTQRVERFTPEDLRDTFLDVVRESAVKGNGNGRLTTVES